MRWGRRWPDDGTACGRYDYYCFRTGLRKQFRKVSSRELDAHLEADETMKRTTAHLTPARVPGMCAGRLTDALCTWRVPPGVFSLETVYCLGRGLFWPGASIESAWRSSRSAACPSRRSGRSSPTRRPGGSATSSRGGPGGPGAAGARGRRPRGGPAALGAHERSHGHGRPGLDSPSRRPVQGQGPRRRAPEAVAAVVDGGPVLPTAPTPR